MKIRAAVVVSYFWSFISRLWSPVTYHNTGGKVRLTFQSPFPLDTQYIEGYVDHLYRSSSVETECVQLERSRDGLSRRIELRELWRMMMMNGCPPVTDSCKQQVSEAGGYCAISLSNGKQNIIERRTHCVTSLIHRPTIWRLLDPHRLQTSVFVLTVCFRLVE